MSLFDRLVDQALQGQNEPGPLRMVVEKELLHHDILREMRGEQGTARWGEYCRQSQYLICS